MKPSYLCRQQLPENGINELEMVTNNTLAGIIAQLSGEYDLALISYQYKINPYRWTLWNLNLSSSLDISRHAEDIFGELTNEAHQVPLVNQSSI